MKCRRVNIVIDRQVEGWILEKIAKRLAEKLPLYGWEVIVSNKIVSDVDVNHHASWAFANASSPTASTTFITHIDDALKLRFVKSLLADYVTLGICMSSDTVKQLTDYGIPAQALCYIPPAHDNMVRPRRIVIGITTHVYPDGRKREHFLERLAGELRLDQFEFRIFGRNWDRTVAVLREGGAMVAYSPGTEDYLADYRVICESVPHFDYYLYLGLDEGSLGTLDALAAGVKTMITPQGTHLDIPHGVTHPIVTYEHLLQAFTTVLKERQQRIDSVRSLTWDDYARRHALVWDHLVSMDAGELQAKLGTATVSNNYEDVRSLAKTGIGIYTRALRPRRIISALSHQSPFKQVRQLLRNRK
jgi:hypothetical protein